MRLLIAAALMLGGAAEAAEILPPPVCGEPGVLREVDEMMRAQGRPMVLEAPPVGEVSLSTPHSPPLAHCAVRGHMIGYHTNRYGMTPLYEPFTVNYTIELRRNGLFVSLD